MTLNVKVNTEMEKLISATRKTVKMMTPTITSCLTKVMTLNTMEIIKAYLYINPFRNYWGQISTRH